MKTYLIGLSILLGAILLNILSSQLGLFSWYDLLTSSPTLTLFNWVYLLVIYPIGLGISAKISERLLTNRK